LYQGIFSWPKLDYGPVKQSSSFPLASPPQAQATQVAPHPLSIPSTPRVAVRNLEAGGAPVLQHQRAPVGRPLASRSTGKQQGARAGGGVRSSSSLRWLIASLAPKSVSKSVTHFFLEI
jgi:hypothetical protein